MFKRHVGDGCVLSVFLIRKSIEQRTNELWVCDWGVYQKETVTKSIEPGWNNRTVTF